MDGTDLDRFGRRLRKLFLGFADKPDRSDRSLRLPPRVNTFVPLHTRAPPLNIHSPPIPFEGEFGVKDLWNIPLLSYVRRKCTFL
jgi:hypothetical protein